jgi:hypothetical protein
MIKPRCLIEEEGTVALFPDGFVGHEKWFRGSRVDPDEQRSCCCSACGSLVMQPPGSAT